MFRISSFKFQFHVWPLNPTKLSIRWSASASITTSAPVLKNIYLSYFYGAKIGVIGLNGSGKSSLLRIMAGVDKEINGEAVLSPGYTVGFSSKNR